MDSDQMNKLQFRKSTRSTEGNTCVEVAKTGGAAYVRDNKNPDSPVLRFSRSTWMEFIQDVKNGDLDR